MSQRITVRVPDILYAQIEKIVETLRQDLVIGTVTLTDVVTNLLNRGVDDWTTEQIQDHCDHRWIGLRGPDEDPEKSAKRKLCPQCGLMITHVEISDVLGVSNVGCSEVKHRGGPESLRGQK